MKNDVKILKLSTGEEVIARVTEQRDLLELDNPMTLQAIPTNQQGQMGFALVPWLMSGKSTKLTDYGKMISALGPGLEGIMKDMKDIKEKKEKAEKESREDELDYDDFLDYINKVEKFQQERKQEGCENGALT